jgi:hypothetical protein
MVTTSLQLSEVATHLASSDLGGNLCSLTLGNLMLGDRGSEACVLSCRGGSLLLAVVCLGRSRGGRRALGRSLGRSGGRALRRGLRGSDKSSCGLGARGGSAALGGRGSGGRRSNRHSGATGTGVGVVGAAGETAAALVDGKSAATTTVLGAVTSAGREAVSEDTGDRCTIRGERVATVALRCVFETCVGVSLARAERNARFDGHGVTAGGSGAEGAGAQAIGTATNVLPLERRSDILEVLLVSANGGDLAVGSDCTGLDGSETRALLNRVAAGKSIEHTSNLLVDLRGDDTGLALLGGEQVEDRAVGQKTAVVGALINGTLKSGNIPTVDEVTVESESSRVTLSKDERLSAAVPHATEVTDIVVDLVEDGDQMNRVRVGALAAVVAATNGVRHVRLVVSRIKVDAIPARGEEDLSTETIGAVLSRKTVGGAGAAAVVETNEADSLRFEVASVVALEGVTSKHTETLGEGLKLVVVGATTLEIIDGHTTVDTGTIARLLNVLERTVLVLVVEGRGPVVREILLDRARGAVRRTSIGIVHLELEAITTRDGVNVAGDLARGNDRVGTLGDNTARAGHTEESSSRCSKSGSQAENLGGSVHLEGRY